MRIQAHTAYAGSFTATIATRRPEEAASALFTGAVIHEDWAAKVRAALKEHKHCMETSLAYPAAQRLQNYFPGGLAAPYFAVRELKPAGSPRDISAEDMLEITRLRYDFFIVLLPAYFAATEPVGDAIERHVEKAAYDLFAALNIPNTHIPSDNAILPGEGTYINLVCELGPAAQRAGIDIPQPAP